MYPTMNQWMILIESTMNYIRLDSRRWHMTKERFEHLCQTVAFWILIQ